MMVQIVGINRDGERKCRAKSKQALNKLIVRKGAHPNIAFQIRIGISDSLPNLLDNSRVSKVLGNCVRSEWLLPCRFRTSPRLVRFGGQRCAAIHFAGHRHRHFQRHAGSLELFSCGPAVETKHSPQCKAQLLIRWIIHPSKYSI